jgi:nucleotide-binding universal stress UspA family protein
MFKRIMIPTDGSALAGKAVRAGMEMAKALGARVVGYYAVESVDQLYRAEGYRAPPSAIKDLQGRLAERGEKILAGISKAAMEAGVPCEVLMTSPGTPHQGIIDVAKKKKCDVIFMATHGRGRLASLVNGSVTQKVLAQSKIPVLVYR